VVLWFKEAYGTWEPDAKSYSDGTNRVSVEGEGVMVEVRIGAVAGHEAEYARLAALGAFA